MAAIAGPMAALASTSAHMCNTNVLRPGAGTDSGRVRIASPTLQSKDPSAALPRLAAVKRAASLGFVESSRGPSSNWSWSGVPGVCCAEVALCRTGMRSAARAQGGGSEESGKAQQGGSSYGVLSFLCPLLKLFSGGDAAAPRNRALEVATTGLASMARLPWGSKVRADIAASSARKQPEKLLQLYEFEACPFCRRVREALTELDLSAELYPCPKDSVRHRPTVRQLGGKDQFPFLVDPNTGASFYESGDIVKYLFKEYGGGADPSPGLLESTIVTGWVPTLARAGRGMSRYAGACPDAPPRLLELYSYENNQFARLVREALCELELPYILRNTGKGSPGRDALLQLAGSTQVPYLVDPNTGSAIGDSEAIVAYLFKTYGTRSAAAVPL